MEIRRGGLISKIAVLEKTDSISLFYFLGILIRNFFLMLVVSLFLGCFYVVSFLFGMYPNLSEDMVEESFKEFKRWPKIFGYRILPIWLIVVVIFGIIIVPHWSDLDMVGGLSASVSFAVSLWNGLTFGHKVFAFIIFSIVTLFFLFSLDDICGGKLSNAIVRLLKPLFRKLNPQIRIVD